METDRSVGSANEAQAKMKQELETLRAEVARLGKLVQALSQKL